MPDRSELDQLERELTTLRANRELASGRYEQARGEEQAQLERRIEATRRGGSITSIDARLGRLRQQMGIESQAIEVLDLDITAAEAAVAAAHRELDRALAEEAEQSAVALLNAVYAQAVEVLTLLEAELNEPLTAADTTVRAWGDVGLRSNGNLLARNDADARLRGTTHLDRLLRLRALAREFAVAAPVPERIVPANPYANESIAVTLHPGAAERSERYRVGGLIL